MGTLIKKIMSDSSYLWLKTMEFEIYISGFQKKACQGCHISELAQWNDASCTSFWSILDPWLKGIVGNHWSRNDPKNNCASLYTVGVVEDKSSLLKSNLSTFSTCSAAVSHSLHWICFMFYKSSTLKEHLFLLSTYVNI